MTDNHNKKRINMAKSKNNKLMMYSFLAGVILLGLAIIIGNLFPALKLGPIAHILLYIVLVAPWIVFIVAILMPSKEIKPRL